MKIEKVHFFNLSKILQDNDTLNLGKLFLVWNLWKTRWINKYFKVSWEQIYLSCSEALFILVIKIHNRKNQRILSLSMKAYIDQVLKKVNMKSYKFRDALVVKGNKLNKD